MDNHSTITCSVYVRNSVNGPSCYYRVIQYVEELREESIDFRINDAWTAEEYFLNLSRKSRWKDLLVKIKLFVRLLARRQRSIKRDLEGMPDIVIISRELFPKYMPLFIKKNYEKLLTNTKVFWDFDDDIFGNGEISEREGKLLATYATQIIGISEYSKTLIPYELKNEFLSLPTTDKMFRTIRLNDVITERKKRYDHAIHLVWVGTVSNLSNIDLIIEELEEAAKILKESYGKTLKLHVICNENYLSKIELRWIKKVFIQWNRAVVKTELEKAHIGIMPLSDNEYSKGKGGFKLIQYLSAGLPVLASDVGFNKEIVNKDVGYREPVKSLGGWTRDIVELATHIDIWETMSHQARACYERKFAFDNHLSFWKDSILEESKNQ